jgi:GT2 family glycosyltransferase
LNNPLISVIIVLYNSEDVLPGVIGALNRSRYKDLEIVLVDNASQTGIDKNDIDCRYPSEIYRMESNLGFGRGCNVGVEKSRGEYVMFLNPDTEPSPEAIDILAGVLSLDRRIGVVGAQLLNEKGELMPSYRYTPNFKRLLFATKSPLSKIPVLRMLVESYIPPPLDELSEVEVVPATAMMVRRDAFLEVGGFDRRFFMYAEDFDLCVMMRKLGYKVYHQPKARVFHMWGKGARASDRFRLKQHNRSIYLFYRKHYPENIIGGMVLYILLKLRRILFESGMIS